MLSHTFSRTVIAPTGKCHLTPTLTFCAGKVDQRSPGLDVPVGSMDFHHNAKAIPIEPGHSYKFDQIAN